MPDPEKLADTWQFHPVLHSSIKTSISRFDDRTNFGKKLAPRIFCLKITFWSRESLSFDVGVDVVGVDVVGVDVVDVVVVVGCFVGSGSDVIVKAKKANFVEEKKF